MTSDPLLPLRIIFICCFFLTLGGGLYLAKNFERLFGVDPNLPSETDSARFYTKTEVFLVWASAVKLFAVAIWWI
ncbi:MAG: hypothetical protein EOP84_22615 [Verrucomicrobiaceae bacterium]|nr:MAG: hypothetical protein EOP84_22615 [Verrucomicrobiaceae bacterium]